MKKLYFLAATLFFGGAAVAQTTVYSATDSLDFVEGSVVDADGDGQAWFTVNLQDTDGQGTAFGSTYDNQGFVLGSYSWDPQSQAALTPDNWWVTPAIDLTNISSAELSWGRASADPDFQAENYSIYVVAAADITAAVTAFQSATPIFNETVATGGEWQAFTEDISQFDGEGSIFVGIRHHDVSDEFLLFVDDITVSGTDATNSINEDELSLKVYPNPAENVLNIDAAESLSSVKVIGMDGRVVIDTEVDGNSTSLDLSSLEAGSYYYEVVSLDGAVSRSSFVKK